MRKDLTTDWLQWYMCRRVGEEMLIEGERLMLL